MNPKSFLEMYIDEVKKLENKPDYPMLFGYKWVRREHELSPNIRPAYIIKQEAFDLQISTNDVLVKYANKETSRIAVENIMNNIVDTQGFITYNAREADKNMKDGHDRVSKYMSTKLDCLAAISDSSAPFC